jgi:hypothetical protein
MVPGRAIFKEEERRTCEEMGTIISHHHSGVFSPQE